MAEPTLKAVLDAISLLRSETKSDLARLEKGQAESSVRLDGLAKDLAAHRAETAVRFESVERNIAAHRRETKEGFDELDKELEEHADPLHRDLEKKVDKLAKEVAALKAARPRAARPARRG